MNVFLINLVQKYGKRFRVAKVERGKVFYLKEFFLAKAKRKVTCVKIFYHISYISAFKRNLLTSKR
ncbi:hypothetical protein BXU01_08515 [[Flexibacter] sp. ATCC 35103]|nr:hypothetical protein BXU01_08515 [[Flexibacter] sp. ATCC 35103]